MKIILQKYSEGIKPYIHIFPSKVISGLLFSVSVLIFVDSKALQQAYSFLILQEFYFSFFYNLKKNQLLNSKKKHFWELQYIISSVIIFTTIAITTNSTNTFLALLAITLLLAATLFSISSNFEKKNIDLWLRTESKSSILGSLMCSLLLVSNYYAHWGWDHYIVITRLPLTHIFSLLISFTSFFSVRKYTRNIVLSFYKIRDETHSFLSNSEIIPILFFLKLAYFGGLDTASQIPGRSIKQFMLGYDISAMLLSIYIRRNIALHKKNASHQIKVLYSASIVCIFLGLPLLIVEYSQIGSTQISIGLISFLIIAITFPIFSWKKEYSTLPLKITFILTVVLIHMSDLKFLILIAPFSLMLYLNKKVQESKKTTA